MTRREFLKTLSRLTVAGGLVWLTARLAGNNSRKSSRPADVCSGDGVCRRCPAANRCGHPTAISFREAGK
jgi:hypothetical protein